MAADGCTMLEEYEQGKRDFENAGNVAAHLQTAEVELTKRPDDMYWQGAKAILKQRSA